MKSIIAFLLRIPLYLFFFWLSFFFLLPKISPEILGMILVMPLASLALLLDVFLTAKIRGKRVEEVVAKRIIIVDNLLAPEGERISDKRRLATRDVTALPEREEGRDPEKKPYSDR